MPSSSPWQLYPISNFDRYSENWDELNQANAQLPILDSDFIRPLIKYFATGREKLAIYRENEKVLAMTIIHRYKLGCWMTFQPSQAPLGCWIQSHRLSMSTLIEELKKELPFPILILSITQQDPNITTRPETTNSLSTLDYITTASIPLTGSFEDYWAQRSKNTRQNMNRQRNRLSRDNIETRLSIITEKSQVAIAIEAYGDIESNSWKKQTDTAIHTTNKQGSFYRELLEIFCQKNKGSIVQYFYNRDLVASDLCIHSERALVMLKTTFDVRMAKTSPAMQMNNELLKKLFLDKPSMVIEFYGKTLKWHEKLSSDYRSLFHTTQSSPIISRLRRYKAQKT